MTKRIKHGTRSRYNNQKCRCPECKAASAAYARSRRENSDPAKLPSEAHGKPGTYTNHACRCDLCKQAWRAYMRDYYRNRKAG